MKVMSNGTSLFFKNQSFANFGELVHNIIEQWTPLELLWSYLMWKYLGNSISI
jgi:hypothetical protein